MDLSSLHPYDYSPSGEMHFVFTTTNGVTYHAYFLRYTDYSPYYGNIFMFNLASEDAAPHPMDIRIAHTVVKILAEFFEDEENSAVIICDNSDNKEFKRHNLFERWYQHFKVENVIKYDSNIETPYYQLYISLFLRRDNPCKENVVKEYYRMISEEFSVTE